MNTSIKVFEKFGIDSAAVRGSANCFGGCCGAAFHGCYVTHGNSGGTYSAWEDCFFDTCDDCWDICGGNIQ